MKIWMPSLVAACYDASCRPPTSGGTGGSRSTGMQWAHEKGITTGPTTGIMRAGRKINLGTNDASRPTTTKGGSGNTSVVPSDPHAKVRASDSHKQAPGAGNLAAVRGHRGIHGTEPDRRIPRQGETVDVFRDLGRGREFKRGFPDHDAFSVRLASGHSGANASLVTATTVGVELRNGRPAWAQSAKREAETTGKRGVHGFIRGEVHRYMSPSVATSLAKQKGWEKVTYYPGTQDFFQPGTRRRFVSADRVILAKGEFFAFKPTFHDKTAPVSKIEKRLGLG